MSHSVTTCQCPGCGQTMQGRVEDYRYVESGLKTVMLHNILVFHCEACGEIMPQIVSATDLHRRIACLLLTKDSRLTGDEFRFLRKMAGYSTTELAKELATSKSVVSRWETKCAFGKEVEQLFRMLCASRLIVNILDDIRGQDPQGFAEISIKIHELTERTIAQLKRLKSSAHSARPLQIKIDPSKDIQPWLASELSLQASEVVVQ